MSARTTNILIWVLRIAVAGLFFLSATQKLIGDPQYLNEFAKVGLGDWFMPFTASIELLSGLAVLYPPWTPWGAIVLLAVDGGALVAHLTRIHGPWTHCIGIGLLIIALIYLTRSRFGSCATAM